MSFVIADAQTGIALKQVVKLRHHTTFSSF